MTKLCSKLSKLENISILRIKKMDISTNPELVSVNTSPAVCPVIDVPGPSLLITVRDNPPRTGRLRRKVMRGKPRHGAVTYSGYSQEMETKVREDFTITEKAIGAFFWLKVLTLSHSRIY